MQFAATIDARFADPPNTGTLMPTTTKRNSAAAVYALAAHPFTLLSDLRPFFNVGPDRVLIERTHRDTVDLDGDPTSSGSLSLKCQQGLKHPILS